MGRHRLTLRAVASDLGVTPTAVHRWTKGLGRPGPEMRLALDRYTSGAVPASVWLRGDEVSVTERVRPFVPASENSR